ncbi:DNA polymerase epsilon catalytic subunit A, partial [Eurytemora carolleeae]|uniref:DNA polymerase epsilon catalytic subunit A n=1 Tax=Eurytemora carolleeae TaxID=1294199 RepID=UPI000C792989
SSFLYLGQKKASVFVVDTVQSNQLPGMTGMYNSERAAYISKPDRAACTVPDSDHVFEVYTETDIRKVYKAIGKILSTYMQEKRGPTVVGLQSGIDLTSLVASIPQLGDIPVIPIHVQDTDNLYSVLDWQKLGARTMIRHYLKSDLYIASTIEHCRYLHIPAGNLPKDTTVYGADIFYARYLRKQNFVLWASNSDTPDFGGKEADDGRLQTDQEEGFGIVINNDGFYKNVCVELDIDALAVNTLLQSQITSRGLASYDETALVAPAFRVLRTMVGTWLRDVVQYKNVFADYQIIHFYRWLRSPKSLLYDPALRKSLLQLMKKLLLHLIAEFKRLGAVIIFADFNRIIISTKKRQYSDASTYVDYISQHIRNKEMFHCINIRLASSWDILLWLDPANYGGVKSRILPERTEEDEEVTLADEDEDDAPEIAMTWNLANFLPEEGNIRGNFNRVVVGYISAVNNYLEREKEKIAPGETPIRKRKLTLTPGGFGTPSTNPNRKEPMSVEEFADDLVSGELSQRLFGVVEKINKKFPEHRGDAEDSIFPSLPGSHLKLTHPALEFVKAICKVLYLDTGVEKTVTKMRRNLLKLLNVGEFNPAAEWKDPCISFILPEVICKSCNFCRDLDLCKDGDQGEVAGTPVWICSNGACQTPYNSQEIEAMLVDCVKRKTMGYILQDLTCDKCKEVTQYNMAKRCRNKFCAGNFETTISSAGIGQILKTFQGVSEHYKMPLLQELVNWTFRMNGDLAAKFNVQLD